MQKGVCQTTIGAHSCLIWFPLLRGSWMAASIFKGLFSLDNTSFSRVHYVFGGWLKWKHSLTWLVAICRELQGAEWDLKQFGEISIGILLKSIKKSFDYAKKNKLCTLLSTHTLTKRGGSPGTPVLNNQVSVMKRKGSSLACLFMHFMRRPPACLRVFVRDEVTPLLKLGHILPPPGGLLRHSPLKPLTRHLWAPYELPSTHTHSCSCSSYTYPWPVCFFSVISFISAHSRHPQKCMDGETWAAIHWLADHGFKASCLASKPLPSCFFFLCQIWPCFDEGWSWESGHYPDWVWLRDRGHAVMAAASLANWAPCIVLTWNKQCLLRSQIQWEYDCFIISLHTVRLILKSVLAVTKNPGLKHFYFGFIFRSRPVIVLSVVCPRPLPALLRLQLWLQFMTVSLLSWSL